jgi:putative transposase
MNLPDHHRRSIRLKGYDYTQPGAYFVTICACQREEIFGTVINGVIQLSPIGKIVQAEWFHSAEVRKEIRLFEDEFVVMPNHMHGIVWIVENEIVGADGVRPDVVCLDNRPDGHPGEQPRTTNSTAHCEGAHPEEGTRRVPLQRAPRSLSSFIAGYKAAVTSRAGRELDSANIWQRNYYERIIRSEEEFQNIWKYIDTNLLRWAQDQLHPSASPNQFNQDNP